jgi:hypothetical protein
MTIEKAQLEEILRHVFNGTTVDLTQLEGMVFIHYKNEKQYIFTEVASLQINDQWVPAVVYHERGVVDLYVRPAVEFFQKFRWEGVEPRDRQQTLLQSRPATPMCDRLAAVQIQRDWATEFLEWLIEHYEDEHVCNIHPDRTVMSYLEIDERVLDDERRALLEWQRQLNDAAD